MWIASWLEVSSQEIRSSGSFSYDNEAPDVAPDPTLYSCGSCLGSITGSLTAGNYSFQGVPVGTADLHDLQSSDALLFVIPYESDPHIDLSPNPGRAIFLNFADGGGTVFSDDTLPTTLNLSDFSSAEITIHGDSGPGNPVFSGSWKHHYFRGCSNTRPRTSNRLHEHQAAVLSESPERQKSWGASRGDTRGPRF